MFNRELSCNFCSVGKSLNFHRLLESLPTSLRYRIFVEECQPHPWLARFSYDLLSQDSLVFISTSMTLQGISLSPSPSPNPLSIPYLSAPLSPLLFPSPSSTLLPDQTSHFPQTQFTTLSTISTSSPKPYAPVLMKGGVSSTHQYANRCI